MRSRTIDRYRGTIQFMTKSELDELDRSATTAHIFKIWYSYLLFNLK
jgi:hypothetical protein